MRITQKRKIGAHVSAAGGYDKAIKRLVEIGGNCLQIFSTSPRTWSPAKENKETTKLFLEKKKELGIDPIYFHASYLINLGDTSKTGFLSKKILTLEMNLAPKLDIKGSIIHPGSFKDKSGSSAFDNEKYNDFIKNIKEVLKKTPKEALLIIENSGTKKIGKSMEEIERIIKDTEDNRVRVCLDTCHLHAAGYDLSTKEKLERFLSDFDEKIGLEKLETIHINDSRDSLGSFRDRHENIGKGKIKKKVFKLLLNHPKLNHLPFILETPGFENFGPDKKNLDILKRMYS